MASTPHPLDICVVGAGLGGLATALSLSLAGARVTVLEASAELGEIGAGIQMTPNASRLLQKWGVDTLIGSNLVRCTVLNMRRHNGTPLGRTEFSRVEQACGHPWWLVHRAHLHTGLVERAQEAGSEILTGKRVSSLEWKSESQVGEKVHVRTEDGGEYMFDLVIGADGLHSIVRAVVTPDVEPVPPTKNAAFRAVVPWVEVQNDPICRELASEKTMEVWMGKGRYIISYPISGGKDFNMVLSHHVSEKLWAVQPDVSLEELQEIYKDFDPRIRAVVGKIKQVSRWPLLALPPLPSWSTPMHNVTLIGDAAHAMTNHMAQGAATSMEDGAFLSVCLSYVLSNQLTLADALHIYETARKPLARQKQILSFLNGQIWMLPEGPTQRARDSTMRSELKGEQVMRSANTYGDPRVVEKVFGYDAEAHAEREVKRFLGKEREEDVWNEAQERWMDWFEEQPGLEEVRSGVFWRKKEGGPRL